VEPVRHWQTKGPRETPIIRRGRKIYKPNQSWKCIKLELYSASVFWPFPWPLIGRKPNMLYSSVNKTLSGLGERCVLIGNEAEFLLAWPIDFYVCKSLDSKPTGEHFLSSLCAYNGLSRSCWSESLTIYKLTFKVVHFRLYTTGPAILPLLEIPLKPTFFFYRV